MWFKARSYTPASSSSPQGFTLMELVVAAAIFSITIVVVAEIFVNLQKTQRRVRNAQQATTEMRYLMDVIAREIRSDTIDYSGYKDDGGNTLVSIPARTNVLRLLSPSKERVIFYRPLADEATVCPDGNTNHACLLMKRIPEGMTENQVEWSQLNSPEVTIDLWQFYPAPLTDPFPGATVTASTPDQQPQVTMVVALRSRLLQDQTVTYLQTTIATRGYYR